MPNPCISKVRYDSEWEAERAASISGSKFGTDMIAYSCENHWHIANSDPANRSRGRPDSKTYCEVCNTYMKRGRYRRHVTTKGHRYNERKL